MENEKYSNTEITEKKEFELDFFDLFNYFRKKILWIAGAFAIGALLAGLITICIITPKYTATATMYMVSSSSGSAVDLTDLNVGSSLSSDYVELVKTRTIVEDVIKEQNLNYTYEDLIEMLDLSVVTDTRIMKINVTGENPKEVAAIANSLATKAEIELPKLMDTPKPHIAEKAIVPVNKSSPSLTKNTITGALLLMLIMLAFLTLMYLMDDTIKSADELEKRFGIIPLTVVPEGKIEGINLDEAENKKLTKALKGKRK